MTAKEYLQEIRRMDMKIDQMKKELKDIIRSRTDIAAVQTDKMPGPGVSGSFTKMSDKIIDMQQEVEKEIEKLCHIKHKRISQMQHLKPEYTAVLFKRYVEYKTFERIAVDMNYSYRYIINIHGIALREFEEKFLKN